MAKLTEKEREGFENILGSDLGAINQKLMEQIKIFWSRARADVIKIKGWDKLIQEKLKLKEENSRIVRRMNEIEAELNSSPLTPEQVVELGGRPNDYGQFKGANFYGIPVTSQFEYEIVEYIREHINIDVPAKIIADICRASMRELTMAGTFEEARQAYEKFYSLDFRKYGVDIPPRLAEIKQDVQMLSTAQETLKLENKEENVYLEYKEASGRSRNDL